MVRSARALYFYQKMEADKQHTWHLVFSQREPAHKSHRLWSTARPKFIKANCYNLNNQTKVCILRMSSFKAKSPFIQWNGYWRDGTAPMLKSVSDRLIRIKRVWLDCKHMDLAIFITVVNIHIYISIRINNFKFDVFQVTTSSTKIGHLHSCILT